MRSRQQHSLTKRAPILFLHSPSRSEGIQTPTISVGVFSARPDRTVNAAQRGTDRSERQTSLHLPFAPTHGNFLRVYGVTTLDVMPQARQSADGPVSESQWYSESDLALKSWKATRSATRHHPLCPGFSLTGVPMTTVSVCPPDSVRMRIGLPALPQCRHGPVRGPEIPPSGPETDFKAKSELVCEWFVLMPTTPTRHLIPRIAPRRCVSLATISERPGMSVLSRRELNLSGTEARFSGTDTPPTSNLALNSCKSAPAPGLMILLFHLSHKVAQRWRSKLNRL